MPAGAQVCDAVSPVDAGEAEDGDPGGDMVSSKVSAGPSCQAAAPPHSSAKGHAGRAAGAPRHVPTIDAPGLRVTGRPGANHPVTHRAAATALPITSHQRFTVSCWVQPADGCHRCPHTPRTCHRRGDISATSTLCHTARQLSFSPQPGLGCVVFLFLL